MADGVVTVTAFFRVRAGDESRFLEAAEEVARTTRAEDGCVEYRLHRHRERPGSFALYENWRSQSDLDGHLASPHIRVFLGAVEPILDEEIAVDLWNEIR